MTAFARLTLVHHAALKGCCPAAKDLYDFGLMAAPAGTPIDFVVDDFQKLTAQTRERGEYCLDWIRKSIKQLSERNLIQIIWKAGARTYKLAFLHPPDTFANKTPHSTMRPLQKLEKTLQKGASNPDSTVPIYRDIEQQTDPTHPPVGAQEMELDSEVATKISLPVARVAEEVTPEISDPVEDNPPPPSTNKCDEEKAALVAEARELIAPIPLNPQLQKLVVEAAASVVKAALQAVREQKAKGGVRNLPGLLVTAIRQQWVPTEAPYTGDRLPQELLDWYPSAIAAGFVQDLPLRWLPTVMGEVQVRVDDPSGRQPYVLESWRRVKAMMSDA